MQRNIQPNYGQGMLLRKINTYFKKVGRPLLDETGYCHGITLLWLQKMADHKEQQFYDVIKRIIDHAPESIEELDDDIDVQKFISQIEFAQNPSKYIGATQNDVDVILETEKEHRQNTYFSKESLIDFINRFGQGKNSIVITSHTVCAHSVGIFLRDNKYYVFDPNYRTGVAKCFDRKEDMAAEVAGRLYDNFGLQRLRWMDLRVIMVNALASPPPRQVKTVTSTTLSSFSQFFPWNKQNDVEKGTVSQSTKCKYK